MLSAPIREVRVYVCVGGRVLCVFSPSPVPEVIVLSSPAPERIWKSINLLELPHRQATDASEKLIIGEPWGDNQRR